MIAEGVDCAYRVRKKRMPILAGTVPCPTCLNRPRVQRHTPNFARLFKIERPPFEAVSLSVAESLSHKHQLTGASHKDIARCC